MLVAEGVLTEAELEERREWLLGLVELLRVRARTVAMVAQQAKPYLVDRVEYVPAAVAKHWKDPSEVRRNLEAARESLRVLPAWDAPAIEAALRETAERLGVGFGKVVQPVRIAVTGDAVSAGIDQLLAAVGREYALRRIGHALEYLTPVGQ